MSKNNSAAVKIYIVFFYSCSIDFPRKIHAKSRKNDGKQLDGTKPCKNPRWQRSFSQKNSTLGKTGLERPPGGRRTAPDVHLAPPRHHFTSILDELFGCFFTRARWETHSFLQGRFRDFLLFPRTFSLDSKLVVDFTGQSKILIFSVNLRLIYAFISLPH